MSQIPSKSDFTKQILSKSDNLKGGGGGGGMVMRMKGGFRWGELSILPKCPVFKELTDSMPY